MCRLIKSFCSIHLSSSRNGLRDEPDRTCLSCRGGLWVLHSTKLLGPLERTAKLTKKFQTCLDATMAQRF